VIKINNSRIDTGERPYVIAEVGINARNDMELAKAHIDAAANAGADAVKFQTHLPDEEMHQERMADAGAEDVYRTISKNEWSVEEHRALKSHCDENNVDFLSTPFSTAGLELLLEVGVPAIKIGSGELRNRELLARAVTTGLPLIVSTGMASHETVRSTSRFLSERTDKFALLYCVSAYPTQPEDINLSYIDRLREETGVPVGFSDHSVGIKAPALAIEHGVSIIEKHFTIDRRLPGPDQAVSLTPEELTQLVEFIQYSEQTGGEKNHSYPRRTR
jgi:Sialic acid synthase